MEKLILIDGNSLINRAFYAMPLLSTKNGIYTNAVYGFMNMFFKLISEQSPSHVAVAFDMKAPTFRHKMFADYKGTRKPMPEELRPQIPLLKDLLKTMNVCVIEQEGIEADDIIGTIAKHTNIDTIIVTGDKDSFQLVDSSTQIFFTRKGITETEIYNNSNFTEKTGISPLQIIDLKSLMGDSSDNIPGIKGIGEKTALSLIQQYGSSENIYEHLSDFSGKLLEKISSDKEMCFLSKKLATINTNCDIDTDLNKMIFTLPLSSDVKKRFLELEFKSLYKKDDLFEEELGTNIKKPQKQAVKTITLTDNNFSFPKNQTIAISINKKYIDLFIDKTEYRLPIIETLLDQGFYFDSALSFCLKIASAQKTVIVFNKKDFKHLFDSFCNSDFNFHIEDVSLMDYLLDSNGGEKTEEELLSLYDGNENPPAFALFSIYESLTKELEEQNLYSLYKDLELPLSDVLFEMEKSGFKIDINALSSAGEKYQKILSELETEISTLAKDDTLNVNSPKQLGEILFEKLKIGKGKKTKTGYSTSAEILEELEDSHPIVPLILRYRQIQKLQSTYIEGLKPLIDKNTGLVHTSFRQTVTSTGRLSSKEPNLQNIPVRDDEGKELRKFFVPKSSDRVLIGADYSQIELRLLASFSNCEELIKAFKEGKDIHTSTASKVFNVPLDKVTKTMRSNAKAVNFGIIYGISEYGLAKNLKISPSEAKNYIESYFKEYPKVKEYMENNVAFAKKTGYSLTFMNRKRIIREINSSNYNLRSFGERVAMNMPLQGSAADIIKLAMLGVFNRLKKEGLKSELILQIHDELIIDALNSEKDKVKKILQEEMENAVSLKVKLTVEVGEGKTWFDAK